MNRRRGPRQSTARLARWIESLVDRGATRIGEIIAEHVAQAVAHQLAASIPAAAESAVHAAIHDAMQPLRKIGIRL